MDKEDVLDKVKDNQNLEDNKQNYRDDNQDQEDNYDHNLEEFIKNWTASLDRNDQMALALCVQHVLSKHAGLKAIFAANVAADLVGYSELYESGRVVFMLQVALFWTASKDVTHEEDYCGRMRI